MRKKMRWGLIILLISYIIVYLNTRSHFWTIILIGMTYFLGFTKTGRRKVKIFVQKELIGGIKQTKNKSKASQNFNDMQRKAFVFLTEDNTFLYKILSFLKLKEPMLTEEEFINYTKRFWVDQDQAKKECALTGELKYEPIKIFEFVTRNSNKKHDMYTKEIRYGSTVSNILRVGWGFITDDFLMIITYYPNILEDNLTRSKTAEFEKKPLNELKYHFKLEPHGNAYRLKSYNKTVLEIPFKDNENAIHALKVVLQN